MKTAETEKKVEASEDLSDKSYSKYLSEINEQEKEDQRLEE